MALWLLALAALANPFDSVPAQLFSRYVDLHLLFQGGTFTLVRTEGGTLARPDKVPRFAGRFEVRLLRGGKPVPKAATVQFNVPLGVGVPLDTEESARQMAKRIARGVEASLRIRVPLLDRTDTAVIWDLEADKAPKELLRVDLRSLVIPAAAAAPPPRKP